MAETLNITVLLAFEERGEAMHDSHDVRIVGTEPVVGGPRWSRLAIRRPDGHCYDRVTR
jgi:hypothetical protein